MFDLEMYRQAGSFEDSLDLARGGGASPSTRRLRQAGTFEEQQRLLKPGNPGSHIPRPTPQPAEMPEVDSVDITVVDDTDWMGIVAARLYRGEIKDFRTVAEMVDRVLARAGEKKIGTLRIIDHGNSGVQQVGEEHVELGGDPQVMTELARLRGHFAYDGKVLLRGCKVAKGARGRKLLTELANLWGVPVVAGEESQYPLPKSFLGKTVECSPSGWGPDGAERDQPDCVEGMGKEEFSTTDELGMVALFYGLQAEHKVRDFVQRDVPGKLGKARDWVRKKIPKFW